MKITFKTISIDDFKFIFFHINLHKHFIKKNNKVGNNNFKLIRYHRTTNQTKKTITITNQNQLNTQFRIRTI